LEIQLSADVTQGVMRRIPVIGDGQRSGRSRCSPLCDSRER
jgi:hypothetical protein